MPMCRSLVLRLRILSVLTAEKDYSSKPHSRDADVMFCFNDDLNIGMIIARKSDTAAKTLERWAGSVHDDCQYLTHPFWTDRWQGHGLYCEPNMTLLTTASMCSGKPTPTD